MGRGLTWGAEIDPTNGEIGDNSSTGTWTKDTTVKRSGAASIKFDSTGSNVLAAFDFNANLTGSTGTFFYKTCMAFQSLPTSNAIIARFGASIGTPAQGFHVRLNSDGSVSFLRGDTAAVLFSSAAGLITADSSTFYVIEGSITIPSGTTATDCELRVNQVSIGTSTGLSVTTGVALLTTGWCTAPGASKQCWADDISVNDPTGSANNSWCGLSKIILMLPKSDSQIGLWTGGVGGTTNLFDAVNNTPPIGTASETNLTQIENTSNNTGSPTTNEYRGDCGSFIAAGMGANDTVNVIFPVIVDGEDVATGTKTGSFGAQANPSQTYATFTFGDDVGALGTYATNWAMHAGTIIEAPAVTMGSSFIIAVRKTDTGTRVASVCFLGAYVDYTPAAAQLISQPCNLGNSPGIL